MSNLYEKYNRLLKAGMPSPPTNYVEYEERGYISADDAHDLITAHAMRWWLGKQRPLTAYIEIRRELDDLFWTRTRQFGIYEEPIYGSAETILDAILAAVEKEGDE